MATTQISLVRMHTEKTRPPRALWVSFELGRPFGPPDDADFQRAVLVAALELLEAPSGPLLLDYPHDAPPAVGEQAGWACPLNLAPPKTVASSDTEIARADLIAEISSLQPWYDRAIAARQRTTFGISGLEIEAIVALLGDAVGEALPTSPRPDVALCDMLRLSAEDLKAFYIEAASAQPGDASGDQLRHWFWSETSAARVLRVIGQRLAGMDDPDMSRTGRVLMVPRAEA